MPRENVNTNKQEADDNQPLQSGAASVSNIKRIIAIEWDNGIVPKGADLIGHQGEFPPFKGAIELLEQLVSEEGIKVVLLSSSSKKYEVHDKEHDIRNYLSEQGHDALNENLEIFWAANTNDGNATNNFTVDTLDELSRRYNVDKYHIKYIDGDSHSISDTESQGFDTIEVPIPDGAPNPTEGFFEMAADWCLDISHPKVILAFDWDQTLVEDAAERHEGSNPYHGAFELLEQLVANPDVKVVIITSEPKSTSNPNHNKINDIQKYFIAQGKPHFVNNIEIFWVPAADRRAPDYYYKKTGVLKDLASRYQLKENHIKLFDDREGYLKPASEAGFGTILVSEAYPCAGKPTDDFFDDLYDWCLESIQTPKSPVSFLKTVFNFFHRKDDHDDASTDRPSKQFNNH